MKCMLGIYISYWYHWVYFWYTHIIRVYIYIYIINSILFENCRNNFKMQTFLFLLNKIIIDINFFTLTFNIWHRLLAPYPSTKNYNFSYPKPKLSKSMKCTKIVSIHSNVFGWMDAFGIDHFFWQSNFFG
jgi:hypothetical protein